MWKDINGYVGLYEACEDGSIRNSKTKRLLRPCYTNSSGYGQLNLRKNNLPKTFLIHRLIAETFLDNPSSYDQINHIDEDKRNNCVANLEWCTAKHNANHGTRIDRCNRIRKNNTSNIKSVVGIHLQTKDVIKFPSVNEASRNGFDKSNIIRCCNNVKGYRSHKGYEWYYDKKQTPPGSKNLG